MRKKVKYIIVLLIIVIIFVLYRSYTKYDESKMPLIVFQFSLEDTSYNYPSSYSTWTIDNRGEIYYFNIVRSLEYEEEEDIQAVYEELKQDKYARYVGTIEQDVLQEKYGYFHEILKDNHYEKDVSGYNEDGFIETKEYKGTWMWNAYAVSKEGNAEMIALYGEGDVYYTSEDERMKELADWLDEILQEDIKGNKMRCQQLKSEEDYKKWLEYKKLNQTE